VKLKSLEDLYIFANFRDSNEKLAAISTNTDDPPDLRTAA